MRTGCQERARRTQPKPKTAASRRTLHRVVLSKALGVLGLTVSAEIGEWTSINSFWHHCRDFTCSSLSRYRPISTDPGLLRNTGSRDRSSRVEGGKCSHPCANPTHLPPKIRFPLITPINWMRVSHHRRPIRFMGNSRTRIVRYLRYPSIRRIHRAGAISRWMRLRSFDDVTRSFRR